MAWQKKVKDYHKGGKDLTEVPQKSIQIFLILWDSKKNEESKNLDKDLAVNSIKPNKNLDYKADKISLKKIDRIPIVGKIHSFVYKSHEQCIY